MVSTETWETEVTQFSENLANMPTKAIGLIKRNLKFANQLSFDDFLEKEAEGQRIAGLTHDHQEGVQAFIEKRKPVFIGN